MSTKSKSPSRRTAKRVAAKRITRPQTKLTLARFEKMGLPERRLEFLKWVHAQPAERTYNYCSPSECALAQFGQHLSPTSKEVRGGGWSFRIDGLKHLELFNPFEADAIFIYNHSNFGDLAAAYPLS